MRTNTMLHVHDTDPDLYASLTILFGETVSGEHRWVKLRTDIAEVTFFGALAEPGVLTAPPSDPYEGATGTAGSAPGSVNA